MTQRTALILGGAGFIGMALTERLKREGLWVRAVDIREPTFAKSCADELRLCDLRRQADVRSVALTPDASAFDEVFQLACDMGGAGYIFTGEHDADVMANNVLINTSVARVFSQTGCGRLLYTSSSCVYDDRMGSSEFRATHEAAIVEADAYLASPSNGYGWEKLFSEQLYQAHAKNYGLNVCITRFSTIYGPGSAFDDGREKAVAAICRKVIAAPHGGEVEVWGDGNQVRPLIYIDDVLGAITALVRCGNFNGPVNIATSELTTCNDIARMAIALSNKRLTIKNVPGPTGKQVLEMSTKLAEKHLGWRATTSFDTGIKNTFEWIARQFERHRAV